MKCQSAYKSVAHILMDERQKYTFHNAEIYLNKKPKIDVLASWFLPNHLPLVFMADVNAL